MGEPSTAKKINMSDVNKQEIDSKIADLIIQLKVDKKDRSDLWNKAVGNSIGLLCNSLAQIKPLENNSFDPESLKVAIRIVAVIHFAKEAGSTDAKKRNLNLSLFKNQIPKSINQYVEDDLIIHSYLALNNLKEQWCLDYICNEIRTTKLNENLKPLIQWLDKLNDSLTQKITHLSNAKPDVLDEDEWIIFIIEFVTKNVKKDFSKLDKYAVDFLTNLVSEKNSEAIKYSVSDQINQLSQINNFVLCRSEIANYLLQSRESTSKKVYAINSQICDRYLSTISQLLKFNLNKTEVDNLSSIWKIYESLLAKKDAIKKTNELIAILDPLKESELENLAEGLEYLVADLLATWEELSDNLKIDPTFKELINKLEILKINLNISQYSAKGEVLIYDPLYQEPLSDNFSPTNKVNVFKPGYFQTRRNGTTKVLKKALIDSQL